MVVSGGQSTERERRRGERDGAEVTDRRSKIWSSGRCLGPTDLVVIRWISPFFRRWRLSDEPVTPATPFSDNTPPPLTTLCSLLNIFFKIRVDWVVFQMFDDDEVATVLKMMMKRLEWFSCRFASGFPGYIFGSGLSSFGFSQPSQHVGLTGQRQSTGQHQVNGSVSGFGLSRFGSIVVRIKISVRSTVLVDSVGPSQLGQTWSTQPVNPADLVRLVFDTRRW
ncbi:uncharacterized protein LOC110943936 [Helianthus annuus]|uniref:uncharacterized protein LOC110943936 n=1 Tax=Helianthus annuus TaxID=4232 RepID=UPI00165311B3|nr:uncharacterized protein LOC110943936 [Helianthus annuus]